MYLLQEGRSRDFLAENDRDVTCLFLSFRIARDHAEFVARRYVRDGLI